MSCVAWPNQTPIGTASNFLQCKWVSCSKSYWQGYDLGWYKDMGAPCFPQPNLWLARCASMSWTALKKFVVLSTQELRIGKKPSFHCGRKAWQVLSVLRLRRLLCLFRLAPSCRLRRLARWCEMAQMVSTATQPRYATAMFHSNQPETFPLSAGVSRPYLPYQTALLCSVSAKSNGSSKQQEEAKQEQAAASSSKQQQQQQQGAARSSRSSKAGSSRRQAAAAGEQQGAAAAAASSSKQQQQAAAKQQQQGAASSSKEQAAAVSSKATRSSSMEQQAGEQQAAAAASSRQAAGK